MNISFTITKYLLGKFLVSWLINAKNPNSWGQSSQKQQGQATGKLWFYEKKKERT